MVYTEKHIFIHTSTEEKRYRQISMREKSIDEKMIKTTKYNNTDSHDLFLLHHFSTFPSSLFLIFSFPPFSFPSKSLPLNLSTLPPPSPPPHLLSPLVNTNTFTATDKQTIFPLISSSLQSRTGKKDSRRKTRKKNPEGKRLCREQQQSHVGKRK